MKKLFLALIFVSGSAFAGGCDTLYVNSKQVVVPNTVELCNSFYVVAYDKKLKGPVVSFDKFEGGHDVPARLNAFRIDPRLAPTERAELSDYTHSGYDRGHMTPAADASTKAEERDTFLLSNMTAQSKKLNEGNWKSLEMMIRLEAKGTTYVATGALYGKETLGASKIAIPVKYYKVVWFANRVTEAYMADNMDDADVVKTTVDSINGMTGLNFPK